MDVGRISFLPRSPTTWKSHAFTQIHGIRAPVLGDGPTQDGGADAYGTFGFELFRDYLLTIDDPQNEVRIETGGLPRADGLTVLTYHLDLGAPYIDIDVGGHRLRASIDAEMPVG